jgi:hypothetical protein
VNELAKAYWPIALAVLVTGYLAYGAGHRIGYSRAYNTGWENGVANLQARTEAELKVRANEAKQHETRMRACLLDSACRLRNDGWRVD